jgi:hypothetical protein
VLEPMSCRYCHTPSTLGYDSSPLLCQPQGSEELDAIWPGMAKGHLLLTRFVESQWAITDKLLYPILGLQLRGEGQIIVHSPHAGVALLGGSHWGC